MTALRSFLWALAGVLGLAVAAALVFKIWPVLHPQAALRLALDPACDLRQEACVSSLPGGGSVRLGVQPRGIPVLRPLQLEVTVKGLEVSAVEVDFSGVDMSMGFNRPQLQRQSDGRFTGTAMLPVCVRERMQWEGLVMLHTQSGVVAAPYRFWTVRPGVDLPSGKRE